MLENKYFDPSAQKAYVNGINSCVEHVTVVNEAIQHAKLYHKTLHATWFDLRDEFGSVPHVPIKYVMSYYHIPIQIIKGSHLKKKSAYVWNFSKGGGVMSESKRFKELFCSVHVWTFFRKGGGLPNTKFF